MTKTIKATGHYILVKPKMPKTKSDGGILLADESIEADQLNISVAQVIDIGPLAFRDKNSGDPWKSGPWCNVGDWVICPKFGTKQLSQDGVNYSIMNDDEVMGVVDDPESIKAYI